MSRLCFYLPLALGWLLTIGMEKWKNWSLGGWRDLSRSYRFAGVLVLGLLARELVHESAPITDAYRELSRGLLVLEVALIAALAISLLGEILLGRSAVIVLKRMDLTESDISALDGGETMRAVAAFEKVDTWSRAVRHALEKPLETKPITTAVPTAGSVRRETPPAIGQCTKCSTEFTFWVFGCGMANATYAYCTDCGMTAMFYLYPDKLPAGLPPQSLRPLSKSAEPYVLPCACGGNFTGQAVPRCPSCRSPIDPVAATTFIEANTPADKRGWWIRSWHRHSGILIGDRVVYDHWRRTNEAARA